MHKYYYFKDNAYYVMNENNVLERYQVTNNIEMILDLENMITLFNRELNEENTKFRYKPIEELGRMELNKVFDVTPLIVLLEYCFLKENTIPVLVLQTTIFNIFNRCYKSNKNCIEEAEVILESALKEVIDYLKDKLKQVKEISHCQKEIVPLSYLDETEKKIILDIPNTEIDNYKNNIDIAINLNINPQEVFPNYEITYDDLDYQRKILKVQKYFLKTMPEKVEAKLEYFKNESLKFWLYILANGSISVAAITQLLKRNLNINFLSKYQSLIILGAVIINFLAMSAYCEISEQNDKISNPVLELEKKITDL